jgi:eukaryotic-like serine/threonine-protein kinase
LNYAVQIADALAKAHRAGVVHRDLKLANIMVSGGDGRVKVLDTGVAKPMDLREPGDLAATLSIRSAPRTEFGMIVGTVGYTGARISSHLARCCMR